MTTLPIPASVQANLEIIKNMGAAEISRLINIRAGRVPSHNPSAQTLINQFNLIESEIEEGKLAAAAADLAGVRDAICDIVLLAMGQQGHINEIDLDSDFKRMCAYNMTRIPESPEEAEATVEKYKKTGVETEIKTIFLNVPGFEGYLYPVICVDRDQWDSKGAHYPPRKFVKSVAFIDAEFEEIESVQIEVPAELHGLGNLITEPMVDLMLKALETIADTVDFELMSEEEFIADMKNRLIGKRA
mgnify:FL=1